MSKKQTNQAVKTKYLFLATIDVTSLHLAYIRSFLAMYEMMYVEVAGTFLISCDNKFRDDFDKELKSEGINYLLVFVNRKSGSKALVNGLSDHDFEKIKEIVEEN
ncbi:MULTISPECIES: hypothetical protein [Sphingobacterium]|uniref:Uncharacterized protein n=1 Tax=Sphingobacterium litopenaei TaxID=2763500 RepID=A0ABR7YCP4_9SPHI|nr:MULTISPECIES: hypothetical protein [Sphingobacterium]MBD1429076.1 hypothetical protein [Sphingobacterium litopenaei]NGM73890.1 hypothetical protein [Sphingobacterium sp. SGL-16]